MAGVTVSVRTGTAQLISGGVSVQSRTLYNNDSTNGVWVSSVENMKPGNGMLVGPLGTCDLAPNKQVYACVDADVLTAVSVTISDDVSNVQNPVAIAAAAASLLLAGGIPNVLIQDQIFFGGLPAVNNNTGWIPVSKYSSLTMICDTAVTANQYVYAFSNDQLMTSYTDYFTGQLNQQIPVRGKYFKVTSRAITASHITILGSNRPLNTSHDQVFSNANMPALFALASQAFTNGSISTFPVVSSNRNPTGQCFLSGSMSTGTLARGIINYVYTDESFNTQSIPLTDTGEWHLDNPSGALFIEQKLICLPNLVGFNLQFQCRVAGTTAVTLSITSDVT